jgi:predicted trehalose synthase
VVYELRNRPTWVSIPMRAILEQTQRAAGSPESKEIKE